MLPQSPTPVIPRLYMNNQGVSPNMKESELIWLYELIDGMLYFIKGWHLRMFGFPRTSAVKKVFKWKKMNFTTDLPK